MIGIGMAAALTITSAYLLGADPPALPPEQGPHGMSDADLWERIVGEGDPLGTMSFGQAVATDPRRIDGLILQRVVQPLYLAIQALQQPTIPINTLGAAMRHGYLQTLHQMRIDGDGHITAPQIATSMENSWRMLSDVLRVAFTELPPEARLLKDVLRDNRGDIRRAFIEANEITIQAIPYAPSEGCRHAWARISATLRNMSNVIERNLVENLGEEAIDDEIQWARPPAPPTASMGALQRTDLFGALTLGAAQAHAEPLSPFDVYGDDEDEDDALMGAYEFEEHVVTGHRSPAIGLSQYRQMGGRYYAGT